MTALSLNIPEDEHLKLVSKDVPFQHLDVCKLCHPPIGKEKELAKLVGVYFKCPENCCGERAGCNSRMKELVGCSDKRKLKEKSTTNAELVETH